MKKNTFLFLICLTFFSCNQEAITTNKKDDIQQIKVILAQQTKAWNKENLEGFMQGYWQSDSLKFYGSNGITKGWKSTLENYKKSYPTKEYTGTLKFKINDISQISKEAYWVMGSYFIDRVKGNVNETFMIIFKKINNEWVIIGDSSC